MEFLAAAGTNDRLLLEVFTTGNRSNDSPVRFENAPNFSQCLPRHFGCQMFQDFRDNHRIEPRIRKWNLLDIAYLRFLTQIKPDAELTNASFTGIERMDIES